MKKKNCIWRYYHWFKKKLGWASLLCRPSVTPTKQGVELGRVLATDTHGSWLQLTQRGERNTEAFGSHGRSARFHILIPGIKRQEVRSLLLHTASFSVQSTGEGHLPGSCLFDPVLTVNFPTERNLCNLIRKDKTFCHHNSQRGELVTFQAKGEGIQSFWGIGTFANTLGILLKSRWENKEWFFHHPKSILIELDITISALTHWVPL